MKKTILLIAICSPLFVAPITYAEHHKNPNASNPWEFSDAVSVSNRASFELDIEPKRAMYLFTAEGEKPWIPGWDPAILKGDGYEIGSVFAAPMGTFVTVDFNTDTFHIFYTYASPVEASTIEIDFEGNNKGGSVITIQWNSTGLSPEGNAQVSQFDQEALQQRLLDWKDMIESNESKVNEFLSTVPRN